MSVSAIPNRWKTRPLLLAATLLALCRLVFSLGVFAVGHYALGLDTPHVQTLTFATLIIGSQACVYLLRERSHCWTTRPSRFLFSSTAVGVGLTALLALGGILMAPIQPVLFLAVIAAALAYYFALDWFKVRLFARLSLR